MAREYDAKLTLKDNFTTVIDRAIKATEALKAKLADAQKQLTAAGKNKIRIGVKLDSSVATSMNRLKGQIPKDKVITLKAKDEVTRTMTNMHREIFKMNKDLRYGLKDPFGGWSRSAVRAMDGLSAMRLMARSVGTSMASALAGGAAAGRIARGGTTRIIPVATSRDAVSRALRSNILLRRTGRPDPDRYEADQRFHRMGRGDVSPIFDRMRRTLIIFDAGFRDMIARQKAVMKRYGVKNYLSQYSLRDTGGPDAVETTHKRLGRFGYAYHAAKARTGEMVLRVKAATASAADSIRAFVQRVQNSKLGEVGMRLKFAGERGAYAWGGIKNAAAGLAVKLQDSGAGKALSSLYSKAASLSGKTFRFTVNAVTAGAKAAIGALLSSIRMLGMAAAAITIGGAAVGIKGAAGQEQNVIAVEHFIKYNNTKQVSLGQANPMSSEEVKKATADYMAMLRKYADQTPFETGDVMNAGRRAINIMTGSTRDAEELIKIAGDMAALNPGKTIMDAMEALADLKVGEFERMKEFGLKISAKEFKALVGKGENDSLTDEETMRAYKIVMDKKLKTMFGGGAAKMGGTAAGLWSTLTGTAMSGLTDIASLFLPGIKAGLTKAIAWIESLAPRFVAAFKPLADAFNRFMTGDGFGKLTGVFAGFSASVQPAIDAFKNLFKNIDLAKAFSETVGAVTAFIGGCWAALAPIINAAGKIIADVLEWISQEVGNVRFYFQELSKIIAAEAPWISDVLVTLWNTVKPALQALWNLAKVIADVFIMSWPLISGVLKTLWIIIKPILQGLASFLELIASGAELAHRMLKGLIDFKNGIGGNIDINVNNSGSKFTPPPGTDLVGDGSYSDRSIGMNYIPYNGYKVNAHRGEAILTRTEADNWRAGNSSGSITINIHDPVVREESDLDRLGTLIAGKLSQVRSNMGAVPAIA